MLADFHFLQPLWLLLMPVLLALSYLWLRVRNTRQYWSDVCDPELLPLLVKEGQVSSRRAPVLAVLISLLLAVAAAQPVWEKQPLPAFKQGGAVVIAWDLSASMNAVDIKPSRLQRSRFKIEDLLSKLKDSQVALLVYAGEAFVVTPLTEDADTIRAQLAAMTPEIMPSPGSRADKALQLAGDMLSQAGVQGGDILLVSDDVAPAQIAAQATRLRQQGRQLSILAVGTAQGAPVPTGYGPLKDQQGKVILARTDLSQMQEAASLGGGDAVMLANDDSDLTRLIAGFSKDKRTSVETGPQIDRWLAKGPWFVLFALPLLLPLFRRGMLNLLLPALLVGAVTAAPEARAGLWQELSQDELWQNLWQSRDQQAAQHYQAGDKAAAARQFSDPRWKQVAQYENAEYEAALDSLQEPQTAADWYNRGNVLARTGKLDEAIAAYDQALQQQADHADAAYNKKLLEDLQQQEEQQKQNQQDQQKNNQQGPQDKQSGQQKDSQNGEPQQSEQNQQPEQPQDNPSDQQQQQSQKQNQNKNQSDETEAGQSATANQQTEADKQQSADNEQQAADYLKQQLDQRQQEQQTEDNASDEASASQTLQQAHVDEAEQARQQLLNRIVDDPAGLWRRKFIYQYRQQADKNSVEEKQW
ncbi:MAG: VWA domain-containing protein [Amphritea sp.]